MVNSKLAPAQETHKGPSCAVQVKIWDIPNQLLKKNLTTPKKELLGHARRVGLIEWHPTAGNILFSSGYDYKVGLCSWGTLFVWVFEICYNFKL